MHEKIKGIFVLILALGCMNLFSDGHLASFIETALSPDSFSCETGDSVPGIGIDPTPNSVYLAIIDNDSDRKFLKLINKLQKFLDDTSDDNQNTLIVFANNHENITARGQHQSQWILMKDAALDKDPQSIIFKVFIAVG